MNSFSKKIYLFISGIAKCYSFHYVWIFGQLCDVDMCMKMLYLYFLILYTTFCYVINMYKLIQGESIERTVGAVITISTMAAAAIGNTFSDILGIGSSYYVEQMVIKLGLKPPNLTPVQLDMKCSRRAANLVRLQMYYLRSKQEIILLKRFNV